MNVGGLEIAICIIIVDTGFSGFLNTQGDSDARGNQGF